MNRKRMPKAIVHQAAAQFYGVRSQNKRAADAAVIASSESIREQAGYSCQYSMFGVERLLAIYRSWTFGVRLLLLSCGGSCNSLSPAFHMVYCSRREITPGCRTRSRDKAMGRIFPRTARLRFRRRYRGRSNPKRERGVRALV